MWWDDKINGKTEWVIPPQGTRAWNTAIKAWMLANFDRLVAERQSFTWNEMAARFRHAGYRKSNGKHASAREIAEVWFQARRVKANVSEC